MNEDETRQLLAGKRIAIPETRQLDVLAGLLERRGATPLPCPLVGIHDAKDPAPVLAWVDAAIAQPFDVLVLLTGEGLRRLLALAERNDRLEPFKAALGQMSIVTRGPKPAKALREIGLKPDIPAGVATTQGVIDSMVGMALDGKRVGVQLYGEDPNTMLQGALRDAGAKVQPVAPYRYADEAEDAAVKVLVEELISGKVDAICFTSSPQVRRLLAVGRSMGQETELRAALAGTTVAAVGPVVADELRRRDLPVHLMPESSWFMKPLVQALVDHWN